MPPVPTRDQQKIIESLMVSTRRPKPLFSASTDTTNIAGCGLLITWAAKAAQVYSRKPDEPFILASSTRRRPWSEALAAMRSSRTNAAMRSHLG